MSTAFTTRRRAERFDALLADPVAGADDARFGELLEVVGQLRAVPAPEPRADFSASLREQLMVEADSVLLPQDRTADDRLALPARTARTARSPRDRRLAAAAGALAMVGATTSMAVAAQTSLPGDALYPVKRALEDVHAGISLGDAARGRTLLANASGRLDEASELARDGSEEGLAAAPGALEDFADQAEEGSALLLEDYRQTGDTASVATVRDFAGQSLAVLESLESQLPEEADDDLLRAAEVLTRIDREAAELCATCGGLGIAEIPPSLVSSVAGEDSPGISSQPVEPARPLQPRDPSAGSGAGSGGSGQGGQGSSGDGSGGNGSGAPRTDGNLSPGSTSGTQDPGGDVGGILRDLTEGLLGSDAVTGGGSGSGSGGNQGTDDLIEPLEQTGKQVDELLDGTGVGKQLDQGLDGTGLTGGNTSPDKKGSNNQGSGGGSGGSGSGSGGSGSGGGSGTSGLLGGLLD